MSERVEFQFRSSQSGWKSVPHARTLCAGIHTFILLNDNYHLNMLFPMLCCFVICTVVKYIPRSCIDQIILLSGCSRHDSFLAYLLFLNVVLLSEEYVVRYL